MNFSSAPDRHKWLSNSSLLVAAKLATSFRPKWKTVKLGDIVERISTGTTPPSKVSRYYDGKINWFTPSDIGGKRWLSNASKTITDDAVKEKKARIFETGAVLITCIGQIGRVGILSQESSSNQQITGVKFVPSIDAEFAYYGLFARQDELQAAAPTASTLPILNQTRLSSIDFCFPKIDEQKQIAKFLSWCEDRLISGEPFTNDYPQLPDYLPDLPRIVSRIEALAGRIAEARSLRQSAVEETDNLLGNAAFKVFTELSKTHKPIPIGKSFTFRNDLIRPTDGKSGEVRFIGLQHIEPNTGKRIGEDKLYAEKLKGRKFIFSPGEIIYGYLRPYLNKVWIADCNGVCSVDQYVIQPNNEKIDTQYLAYFMRSPVFLERAIELTHRLQLPRLRSGLLKSILIPVPPLDEQRRIVAYLDGLNKRVNELRRLQAESQVELEALLPSILDKAFHGEL